MERVLFYSSLIINAVLVLTVFYIVCFRSGKKKETVKSDEPVTSEDAGKEVFYEQNDKIVGNRLLHDLALRCESELPEIYRNQVSILIEKDDPYLPAALQIGNIKISIKRNNSTQSLYDVANPREALIIARDGYPGTGRYIPSPSELDFVLKKREILNVYLRALGLEEISIDDEFWCVNTEAGWNTGWKRFNWNIDEARRRLVGKFWVRDKKMYRKLPSNETAKLFVLLKGWEYKFVEV